MRYIADFHLHSKYSRATSKEMDLLHLNYWAKLKGINILGTSDFTHPLWFKELEEKLIPLGNGLYQLKNRPNSVLRRPEGFGGSSIFFILTTEVSCIYKKGDKTRRIHLLIFAPSLEVVKKLNQRLEKNYNLHSDGRPILGIDAKELLKIILDVSTENFVVPAHAWTPWYSLFGSKSGFDSIEECFEEMTPEIYALETGLSSDPLMNWRISSLDRLTLISNSDAHSPENLGREANVFEGEKINYNLIIKAIKSGAGNNKGLDLGRGELDLPTSPRVYAAKVARTGRQINNGLKLVETIEFFPEEGKYHFDGHRDCQISLTPKETKKLKGICPVCHRPLTIGVLHRVDDLADRKEPRHKVGAPGFKSIIPLKEIIAQVAGVNKTAKKVKEKYLELIKKQAEFSILLDLEEEELFKIASANIVEGIIKMRKGEIEKRAGYDGVYGEIKILFAKKHQEKLF